MNTGHEGSLTTLHANSVRDALARLETMILMAGMDLPLSAIREQIASAIDIVIQQTRFSCGSRIVTHVAEITGIESGTENLQEIFRFRSHGHPTPERRIRGEFTGCGMIPTFYEELISTGHTLEIGIFRQDDTADDLIEHLRGDRTDGERR
jgi:pilus assembly protein CpaF